MSEYDPVFRRATPHESAELDRVRASFRAAARPYVRAPWSWLAWGLVLPTAALATPRVAALWDIPGAFGLWTAAIVLAGVIEMWAIRRGGGGRSPLAVWAMRSQANLSLIGVALSLVLAWERAAWALPGLWLLILGHSFVSLGGLSFTALKRYGAVYQLGGLTALILARSSLEVFAVTTAVANLGLALVLALGKLREPG